MKFADCSTRCERPVPKSKSLPLWLKLLYTLFLCIQIPTYMVFHGPANFLWGSDIALILIGFALWTESRLLASMMATAVLLVESLWTLDFLCRLAFGPDALPIVGTRYMFNAETPLPVRGLSLFHAALPVIAAWMVYRLGYDRRGLLCQTLFAWLVLPLTYAITDPSASINWVYGFGPEPQTIVPGPLWVVFLMVLIPAVLYVPAHLLLRRWFPEPRGPT